MTIGKIEIELIHDVVCSWCPIGYRNIKAALEKLDDQVEAEIRFLAYELNPEMPDDGESIEAHLMRRNGWTRERFQRYRDDLVKTAKKAGLVYDFSRRTHYWNTTKAHTLIHFAENIGKQEQLNQALIRQYFTEGMNVDDTESLLALVESVGLNRMEAQAALASPVIATQLERKRARVHKFNVSSVPTFIINEVDIVRGSNSVDYFTQYFTDLLNRQPKKQSFRLTN